MCYLAPVIVIGAFLNTIRGQKRKNTSMMSCSATAKQLETTFNKKLKTELKVIKGFSDALYFDSLTTDGL